jgi:hypothetical protein
LSFFGYNGFHFFGNVHRAAKYVWGEPLHAVANGPGKEHILWELDSLNILNSGKLWLGNPMGQGQGKVNAISTNMNTVNLIDSIPVFVNGQFVSTHYTQKAQFDFNWADTKIKSTFINPVSGLVYDASANMILDSFSFWPSKNNLSNTNIALQYNAQLGSTGWLDFITIHLTKSLRFANRNSLFFHGQEDAQNYLYELADADANSMVWSGLLGPSKPREFHPQLLTDPDLSLSTRPARVSTLDKHSSGQKAVAVRRTKKF